MMSQIRLDGNKRTMGLLVVLLILLLTGCGKQHVETIEQSVEVVVEQNSNISVEKVIETMKETGNDLHTEETMTSEELSQVEVIPLPSDGEGWGLSFGEAGAQPMGNASVEMLAQYDAYFIGDSEEKVIYLTFDCGYENGNTEPILDALKKHEVSATFFVVGHFLETAPELVKRMVEDGHTVGSHTYHHPDITKLSEQQSFQEEMDAVRIKFNEVTGEELSMYYRPPEGKCSSENMKEAQEMGYSTFFWSLAHVDWDTENQPGYQASIKKLTQRIHPGAVVLLHNTSKTNGEILDELLTKWEEMGYTVRPLAELLE